MMTADNDYQNYKELGNEKFKLKQFEAAKKLYTKAIEAKGDEPIGYLNRAACNINLKLFYDAVHDCDEAIKLNPNLFKAYYRRATSLRELARLKMARDDLVKAAKLDPTSKLVTDELSKLDAIFQQNSRVDVNCYDKPEQFRSEKELKVFQLKNRDGGILRYDSGRVE